jgi:hypothetical protein
VTPAAPVRRGTALFGTEAAAASLLAGICLVAGHALNYGVASGTTVGTALVFAAHVLVVFSFVGIHARQATGVGPLAHLGTVFATLGTVVVSGVVLVELAVAAGVAGASAVLVAPPIATVALVGSLGFVVGVLAVGVAITRGGVLPTTAGWLLVAGTLVFALGTLAGQFAGPVTLAGAVLTGTAFIRVGVALARHTHAPELRSGVAAR